MKFDIDIYKWLNNGYTPKAYFDIELKENKIFVMGRAYEKPVCTYEGNQQPVNRDSCLEWFCNFDSERSDQYINFEFNALGATKVSLGSQRENRYYMTDEEISLLNVKAEIVEEYWQVSYVVSEEFLQKFYPNLTVKSGMEVLMNLYKCGDRTPLPHYGCYHDIPLEEPDYHAPQFFKKEKLA